MNEVLKERVDREMGLVFKPSIGASNHVRSKSKSSGLSPTDLANGSAEGAGAAAGAGEGFVSSSVEAMTTPPKSVHER